MPCDSDMEPSGHYGTGFELRIWLEWGPKVRAIAEVEFKQVLARLETKEADALTAKS